MRGPKSFSLIILVFVASVLSQGTPGGADDIQAVLRYFGQGWGPGYHAYRPACGQCVNQPPWVQSRPCLNRYSKKNFSPNASNNCYTLFGNGACCQQFSPMGSIGYNMGLPQLGGVPAPPHPNSYPPFMRQQNGAHVNPPQPIYRNQSSPLPNEAQTIEPPTNVDVLSIPPLKEVLPQRGQGKVLPSNSGTSGNPFGLPGNARPVEQVTPGNSRRQVIPVQPGTTSFYGQVPRSKAEIARIRAAQNRANQGFRPQQRQQSILRSVRPSNTFNGIR